MISLALPIQGINCLKNVDWMEVHNCDYSSCIATRFRSFYFTFFHNAIIALNSFLNKIKRRASPIKNQDVHFVTERKKT